MSQSDKALALAPLLEHLRPLLTAQKEPVYLVGGAVRDAVLGETSHDLDFVVPAHAISLAFRVGNALSLPAYVLDRERDTGRVVVPATLPDVQGQVQAGNKTTLDFARYRAENLEADLRARDFTINAMALPAAAHTRADLIDPLGGLADLEAGLVRLAHDRALQDDPVRVLRAIRMVVRFGFRLTPSTAAALGQAARLLPDVSPERVRDELVKLFGSPHPYQALQLLAEFDVLPAILPEIAALEAVAQSPPHHEAVLAHTISTLRSLVAIEESVLGDGAESSVLSVARQHLSPFAGRLREHLARRVVGELTGRHLLHFGALFHDAGKAATQQEDESGRLRFFEHESVGARLAVRRMRALRFSKEAAHHVEAIVATHMRPLFLSQNKTVSRRAAYRFFRVAGTAGLDVGLLTLADHLATHDGPGPEGSWEQLLGTVSSLFRYYLDGYKETIAPTPLLGGHELMAELELEPGPEIGRLLRLIEEAQAAGEVKTVDEALDLAHRDHAAAKKK